MSTQDLTRIMAAAMDHATEGICITDPYQPDNPLIYVNKGFLELTGYSHAEVIGKNPRFLQGEKTEPHLVAAVRAAIQEQKAIQIEITNYRKNGESFINKMSISPVFDEYRKLTHFIGVQENITVYKQKQQMEKELEQQRLMADVMVKAAEKERKEIGMDLHDNINQVLTTAKLCLSYAREDENLRLVMIEKSIEVINKTIQEIRKLSGTLTGPGAKELSFKEALKELVNTIKTTAGFQLHYNDVNLDEQLLSETKKIMLYRVLQEQLTNIIRHSRATQVNILFSRSGQSMLVSIRDNGIGFQASQTAEGIGLRNIKSRVELEQGTVQVHATPGAGCELLLKIPLLNQ